MGYTTMAKNLKAGDTLGSWTLVKYLAKGGNAQVWVVEDGTGEQAALKCLQQHLLEQIRLPQGAKKVERFLREIRFYREHRDLHGILPLLDSHMPEKPSTEDPPWLVSKLAIPANNAFSPGAKDFVSAVSFTASVAITLATIHEKGMFHRDLKPENLFLLDEKPLVGDFGLVEIPDLEPLTEAGERVGPLHYVAPEMMADGPRSHGGPADVYSLAKTLWVLATGQTYPLPGEQNARVPALTLSAYVSHGRATLLDLVIERATSINPEARPTMAELARNLEEWLSDPVKDTSPGDLTHLRAKLTAALEPGRRVRELHEECKTLLRVSLGNFESRLMRIRDSLAQVGPVSRVEQSEVVLKAIINHSGNYNRHAGNSISDGVCFVLTAPGSLVKRDETSIPDVHLWSGGGVAVANDTKDIYLAAGHFVGLEGNYPEPVWQEDAVCIHGTADFANAMTRLVNGLIENQEKALDAFFRWCDTVRPRPSVSPESE